MSGQLQSKRRKGAVLAWVAVLLTLLLAITGLSIDGARMFICRAYLQSSSDVAALSGVIHLPNTGTALASAREVLTTNEPAAGNALLDSEVVFGRWTPSTRTFAPGAEPFNALKLSGSRDSGHSDPLPLFFMPIIGERFTEVHAVSTAYAAPRVGGAFSGGLIGMNNVDIGGTSLVDGYNINDGGYGGGNSGLPGSIISNGSMTVHGTPVVTGDARPGVAFTQATVNGNPSIGGTTAALTRPLDLAPVVIPQSINSGANNNNAVTGVTKNGTAFDPLPANNSLSVGTNDTATIPPGNYYLASFSTNGTVNITGPATIRVTGDWTETGQGRINLFGGPVEFFVEGATNLDGQGIVNASQDPRNLTIYSTGPSVRIAGTSDFYGNVYAPFNTTVTITGSSAFFGGAVGWNLNLSGSGGIHTEIGEGFNGPNRTMPVLVD